MKRIVALIMICLMLLSGCGKNKPIETKPPADGPALTVERSEWYNPSITEEQRLQFFELVKAWRVDAMGEFYPDQPMDPETFKNYCCYFIPKDEWEYVSGGVKISGESMKKIAARFDVDFQFEENVFVKAGSLMDAPFAELVEYKEESKDGKLLITARCINYGYNEFMYNDRVETSLNYTEYRQKIIRGERTPYDACSAFDFAFYTEDGKTPTQFVSRVIYYAEDAEGKQLNLPAF